jgi:RimJ/RimL family protein N-acetyltransferase
MSEPEVLLDPQPLRIGPYRLDIPTTRDLDDVVAAFEDAEIALWNPSVRRPGSTLRDRAKLWIADRSEWTSDHASWVVRDVDGTLVGQVSLHHIDTEGGTAEVGYWLTPQGRGRGLGTAAVAAATTYAFDIRELARVELFHAVENEASCRLALRCGFLHEGISRQSYVYGDGLRHDEHLHARLATDPAPVLSDPA